jgi:hypothetical protein
LRLPPLTADVLGGDAKVADAILDIQKTEALLRHAQRVRALGHPGSTCTQHPRAPQTLSAETADIDSATNELLTLFRCGAHGCSAHDSGG